MDIPSNIVEAVKRKPKTFLRQDNGTMVDAETLPSKKPKIELVQLDLTPAQKRMVSKKKQPLHPFDSLKPPPSPKEAFSFFVPKPPDISIEKHAIRMSVHAHYQFRKFKGKKRFITRRVVEEGIEGVRVFRIL